MSYALEADEEFARLERQSTLPAYDCRTELSQAVVPPIRPGMRVLDAGCGSGVLSRLLAREHPGCEVVGCDLSEDRVGKARVAGQALGNLRFEVGDLTRLGEGGARFELAFCRYVMQHLSPEVRREALAGLFRSLVPGGALVAIDYDGPLYNLHPQGSPWLQQALRTLEARLPIDFWIGRQLPQLMSDAGFTALDWRIATISFRGELLEQERELWRERFDRMRGLFGELLGGEAEARRFADEFLAALDAPGCVFFYNKFLVTGFKPAAGR